MSLPPIPRTTRGWTVVRRERGVWDAFGDDDVQSANSSHSRAGAEPELVHSSAVEFSAELLAHSYVREEKAALPHVVPEEGIFNRQHRW